MEKKKTTKKAEKYFEAVGRRKTSTARIRIYLSKKGDDGFLINDKNISSYFPIKNHQDTVLSPFKRLDNLGDFSLTVKVSGGGVSSQAQAIRHGIARALIIFNPDFRKKLKSLGYLKRDPRMVERKKYGLKKARRAPQWSKR
ncbi:MAG: 30S ribosomal protein S9 [Candidatus Paceibacterota bacterium]|jgi:small subunit ribosomal protein S9